MACSVPFCFLIHRTMADGSEGLLMAPDLSTALADAARAGGAWEAQRITLGKDTILEGEALAVAVRQSAAVTTPPK
jgi:hypothetical protein